MKRFFDIFLILIFLLLIIPLLFLGSLFIVLFDGFPIFFQQQRVGLEGKDFKLLKFRTMTIQSGSEKGTFNIEDIISSAKTTVATTLGISAENIDDTHQPLKLVPALIWHM